MRFESFPLFRRLYAVLFMLAVPLASAPALFSSGSTGADGALNVTENTTLPIPPDGLFNYTTINVAEGATLRFDISERNLPIIMLAQGDVTINGTINLNGQHGRAWNDPLAGTLGGRSAPGPGGYHGGIGGQSPANTGDDASQIGMSGGGPGGGAAANNPTTDNTVGRGGNAGSHFTAGVTGLGNPNPAAPTYGDTRLITLSGGSGGAGANFYTTVPNSGRGPGGGGGAGAILIASSTSITVNGSITARGGSGGPSVGVAGGGSRSGGAGAGGTIRLMAQTIGGSGTLEARGGSGQAGAGGNGLIRMEAIDQQGTLAMNSNPPPALSMPGLVSVPPSLQPRVTIVSIGGVAVPDDPGVSLTSPDVVIPASQGDPVTIELETENVPDGAVVTLRIPVLNGETIVLSSTPVSGGTATAQATTIPEGAGAVYASVALQD